MFVIVSHVAVLPFLHGRKGPGDGGYVQKRKGPGDRGYVQKRIGTGGGMEEVSKNKPRMGKANGHGMIRP